MTSRTRGERPQEAQPIPAAQPAAAAPLPINWWKLHNDERSETLETLLVWVPELVRRYSLPAQLVPPCWYLHDALTQELLALFQFRNQMQFNMALGPPPSAPLDFHVQFKLWRDRMREWVTEAGCVQGRHETPRVQLWAQLGTTEHAIWATDAEYEGFKTSEVQRTLEPIATEEGNAA